MSVLLQFADKDAVNPLQEMVMKALAKENQTQSETADFAPGAATWRTGRNVRIVFDSGLFGPL